MIMEENQLAARTISELRALGVRVHLDDFGTGYSALSYLQRYPIDILKIDRSFIAKINGNGENVEIIKSILSLARDLNMKVIAEGIETESQFDILKDLNCEYGQGYFFARPMDNDMIDFLLTSKSFLGGTDSQDQLLDKFMGESKLF
jgi:EAL domain-containing protein (putative c-di-GMP-specific phosphodiesterase class I)